MFLIVDNSQLVDMNLDKLEAEQSTSKTKITDDVSPGSQDIKHLKGETEEIQSISPGRRIRGWM